MRQTPEERLRRDVEDAETIRELKRVVRAELERIMLPVATWINRHLVASYALGACLVAAVAWVTWP